MLYCIIAIVAILVGVWVGRQIANKEVERENEEVKRKNEELDRQFKEKSKQLKDFNDNLSAARNEAIKDNQLFLQSLKENSTAAAEQAESRKELIEQQTEKFKEQKFEKYLDAAARYREQLISDIDSDYYENIIKSRELLDQRCDLLIEISNLQDSRNALIEAAKREEELKLQTDFYKIQISPNNLDDINLIKSIEKHLNNPEPLYKLIWSVFYQKPVKEMLGRVVGSTKVSGIYKITNLTNQKIYIGQSVDVANRITDHIKAALGIGTISHQKIHDVMHETGLENFSFELVEQCVKSELNAKEKLWIKTYQSDSYGYNQTAGGS